MKHLRSLYILFVVEALLIVLLLGPFCASNAVLQWDMPGHLFSAWYTAEYIFPRWTGWNPFFFGGYPQGIFYPPLFHYLLALLSKLVGLQLGFKLLLSATIAALPPALAFLYLRFGLERERAFCAAALSLALLCAPLMFSAGNNAVGVTFYSTFNIGLVANAFAFLLLVLYGAILLGPLSRSGSICAALLLASIVLSHTLTGIVAVFLSLVCASCTIDQRNRFVAIVSSCAAALLLSAVWWVPFLEYLAYAQTYKLTLALGINSYLLLSWGLYLAYRIRNSGYATCRRELVWLFVLAACVILLVNLFDLKLHVYRFVIFPLLLVPPLLLSRTNKASAVKVLNALAIATITYGLGFSGDFWTAIEKRGPPSVDYSLLDSKAGDGRDLVISSGLAQPSRHVAQHYIPMTTRRPAAKGLFVEASQNSSYLLTLERLIDPGAMTWGVPLRPNAIHNEAQAKRVALRLLGLFGIDRVISTQYSSLLRELSWKDLGAYRSHAPYIHFASRPDLGFRLEGLPSYAARIDQQRIVLVQNRGEILRATLVRTDRPVAGPVRILLGKQQVYLRPADSCVWRAFSPMAGNADPLRAAKGLDQLIVKLPEAAQSGEVLELQRWVKESLQQMEIDDFADSALLEAKVEVEEVIDAPARKATWQAEEILFKELDLPSAGLASVVHASSSRQYSPLWEDAVDQWLLEESPADVITDAPQNQLRSFEGEIHHIAVDKTHERIGFEIISDQPVPVLIRESFFPKWHAYQSGNRIPIYRAAPNLMLVVASGQIELRYENSAWEWGAILVSAITLIILTALSLIGALARLA